MGVRAAHTRQYQEGTAGHAAPMLYAFDTEVACCASPLSRGLLVLAVDLPPLLFHCIP